MKNPQKIGRLIFLYIQRDLNFLQAWRLNNWRNLSEDNERFFQQEISTEHIRERLRSQEENMPIIDAKVLGRYPAGWTAGAPRKHAVVIRMLKNAAIFIGSLMILGGGYMGYKIFIETASPRNFAMMAN